MENDRHVSTAGFIDELERQEREQRRLDMNSKKLLTATEFGIRLAALADLLGVTVDARHAFVLEGPSGEEVYPAFMADPAYAPAALDSICVVLDDLPGECKWDFFISPRESLDGMSPLDAIISRKVQDVLAAAHAFVNE